MRIDRLSATGTPSRLEQFQSTAGWGLDVSELQCKLHAQGPLARACVGIALILKANGSSLCGVKVEDGTIVMIPTGTTLSANIVPGFSYAGTTVPASSWAAAQSLENGVVIERCPDDVIARRLPADRFVAIKRRLSRSVVQLSAAEGDPSAVMTDHVALLARAFADCAGATWPDRRGRASHRHLARLAQDWIRAHIGESIRIAELCAAVGTSRRQLEYSFRSMFDVSPHEYICALRLNEIRRALLKRQTRDLSITDIAFFYGVTHLGRFAARYRDLFGELPSQTRRLAPTPT